jgi:hypothetical protein
MRGAQVCFLTVTVHNHTIAPNRESTGARTPQERVHHTIE